MFVLVMRGGGGFVMVLRVVGGLRETCETETLVPSANGMTHLL